MFQIEEKICRFINFKQAQNDSSNIREFCGGMNRSLCETAEGTAALLFNVTSLTLTDVFLLHILYKTVGRAFNRN